MVNLFCIPPLPLTWFLIASVHRQTHFPTAVSGSKFSSLRAKEILVTFEENHKYITVDNTVTSIQTNIGLTFVKNIKIPAPNLKNPTEKWRDYRAKQIEQREAPGKGEKLLT